jgi:hypothetical protein
MSSLLERTTRSYFTIARLHSNSELWVSAREASQFDTAREAKELAALYNEEGINLPSPYFAVKVTQITTVEEVQ